MKKWILLILLLSALFPLSVIAQYGSVNGLCYFGSPINTVPGQYIPGITSACTVTVYNTGTFTPATIYSSATGASLPNPFTIYSQGYWNFYASPTAAYDVVVSGGFPPQTQLTSTYLYDIAPSFVEGSGTAGVSSINSITGAFTFNGTNVSCSSTTCSFNNGGSEEVVTPSATPAFNGLISASIITLSANVTSWTISSGSFGGQQHVITWCENGTGGFTVTGTPANVRGAFSPFSTTTTANTCSSQAYEWHPSLSAWGSVSTGYQNF